MCITVNVWTGCQGILVWCLRVPTAPYHLDPLTVGFYLIKLLPFLSLASVVTRVNKSHRRFGLKKSHYKHFHILLTMPDTVHSSSSGHCSRARYHVHSIDGVATKFRKHFRRRMLLICRKYWHSSNPRLQKINEEEVGLWRLFCEGEFVPARSRKEYGVTEVQLHSLLNSAIDGVKCSVSCSGRITPKEGAHRIGGWGGPRVVPTPWYCKGKAVPWPRGFQEL